MQVFKTALLLVFRFPLYLLLYIVFLGSLGVIITLSNAEVLSPAQTQTEDKDRLPHVAIVNRDGSEVSIGITDFIGQHAQLVSIDDDIRALQDATAQNRASYILIIPEEYGSTFLDAARKGGVLPSLKTVSNFVERDAVLMDLTTNQYLNALRIAALGAPEASLDELLSIAAFTATLQAKNETINVKEHPGASALMLFYFKWISFPMTAGLIVLVSVIFGSFQRGELRRRNLCSPLSPSKMNLQVAFGSLSLVVMTWLFLMLLSFIPQPGAFELISEDPLTFGLFALAALVYAFVPFSIGFLLSQIGFKELASNGIANIVSQVFSFLSGVFFGSISMLSEGVQLVAHGIPTFWYSKALEAITHGSRSAEALGDYFGSLGIVVLFVIAFCSVALFIGHLRAQSAEAGGNPAAEALV